MNELTPADPTIALTVSIVNWNGMRWIRDCLQSLPETRGPHVLWTSSQLERIIASTDPQDLTQITIPKRGKTLSMRKCEIHLAGRHRE